MTNDLRSQQTNIADPVKGIRSPLSLYWTSPGDASFSWARQEGPTPPIKVAYSWPSDQVLTGYSITPQKGEPAHTAATSPGTIVYIVSNTVPILDFDSGALPEGTSLGPRISEVPPSACVLGGWVRFPATLPDSYVDVRRMVKDLLAWTGWSQRHLATILGTSHPTVKRLQEEGSSERSAAVAERLPHIHPVVRRLWLSLDHNPRRVREVLSTPPLPGELSPEQLLKQGKYARAYRIALALVQGIGNEGLFKPPPGASMLEGTHAPY